MYCPCVTPMTCGCHDFCCSAQCTCFVRIILRKYTIIWFHKTHLAVHKLLNNYFYLKRSFLHFYRRGKKWIFDKTKNNSCITKIIYDCFVFVYWSNAIACFWFTKAWVTYINVKWYTFYLWFNFSAISTISGNYWKRKYIY